MANTRQIIEETVRKIDRITNAGDQVIVLKDIAGKIEINATKKTCTVSPTEIGTTGRFYGIPYTVQDKEKFEKEYGFCPTPDDSVELFDGKQFDLKDPYDRIVWNWIKYSDIVAASLEDIGLSMEAQFYIQQDTIESIKHVTKVEQYFEAIEYIKSQDLQSLINIARLFNNKMEDRKPIDIKDYLYELAKETPQKFLDLKNDETIDIKLFFYKALDAGYVRELAEGGYRIHYTENQGITLPSQDSCIAWLMDHKNVYKRDMLNKRLTNDPTGQNMMNEMYPPTGSTFMHNPFPVDNEDVSNNDLSFDDHAVVTDADENATGSEPEPIRSMTTPRTHTTRTRSAGGVGKTSTKEKIKEMELDLEVEKEKQVPKRSVRKKTNIKS